eukprot:IDg11790t1
MTIAYLTKQVIASERMTLVPKIRSFPRHLKSADSTPAVYSRDLKSNPVSKHQNRIPNLGATEPLHNMEKPLNAQQIIASSGMTMAHLSKQAFASERVTLVLKTRNASILFKSSEATPSANSEALKSNEVWKPQNFVPMLESPWSFPIESDD